MEVEVIIRFDKEDCTDDKMYKKLVALIEADDQRQGRVEKQEPKPVEKPKPSVKRVLRKLEERKSEQPEQNYEIRYENEDDDESYTEEQARRMGLIE